MTVTFANGGTGARLAETAAMWRRALLAWLIMAVVMSLNGVFRVKVLAPRWGEAWAGAGSAASGIALIQLIANQTMRPGAAPSRSQRAGIASLWLCLTVGFEFTFGHYVDRKPWAELLANYNLVQGHLWPVILASLVCAPFLWWRGGQGRASR